MASEYIKYLPIGDRKLTLFDFLTQEQKDFNLGAAKLMTIVQDDLVRQDRDLNTLRSTIPKLVKDQCDKHLDPYNLLPNKSNTQSQSSFDPRAEEKMDQKLMLFEQKFMAYEVNFPALVGNFKKFLEKKEIEDWDLKNSKALVQAKFAGVEKSMSNLNARSSVIEDRIEIIEKTKTNNAEKDHKFKLDEIVKSFYAQKRDNHKSHMTKIKEDMIKLQNEAKTFHDNLRTNLPKLRPILEKCENDFKERLQFCEDHGKDYIRRQNELIEKTTLRVDSIVEKFETLLKDKLDLVDKKLQTIYDNNLQIDLSLQKARNFSDDVFRIINQNDDNSKKQKRQNNKKTNNNDQIVDTQNFRFIGQPSISDFSRRKMYTEEEIDGEIFLELSKINPYINYYKKMPYHEEMSQGEWSIQKRVNSRITLQGR